MRDSFCSQDRLCALVHPRRQKKEQPPLLISAAALRTRGGIPITAVDESERRFDASLIRKRRFFVDLLVFGITRLPLPRWIGVAGYCRVRLASYHYSVQLLRCIFPSPFVAGRGLRKERKHGMELYPRTRMAYSIRDDPVQCSGG